MTFTGNEEHEISLTEAAAMTKNYRDTISTGDTIASYIGKSDLQDMLNQAECVGARIYYGLSTTGGKELVLVGVDASGNDLYEGILLDRVFKCPQDCSTANPLNSNVTS
jgi:hypothetical protein